MRCQSCGESKNRIHTCLFCGAPVCKDCIITGYGCKICQVTDKKG